MLNPNKAFIRTIVAVIVIALVKLEVVDPGSQETISDILMMVFTGLGFLLFAFYEFKHLKQQLLNTDQAVKQPLYMQLIKKVLDKFFIVEKPNTYTASTGEPAVVRELPKE
jgi:hypothetical protein